MSEEGVVTRDGVQLAYDVAGEHEPALVFVHGWAGNRSHWDLQVARFAQKYLTVRVDLPGHGTATGSREEWTPTSFALDVIEIVDRLEIRELILIGHSMGGSVIAAAARLLGERVVGVVGVDTWSGLGSDATVEQVESSIMLPQMRTDFVTAGAQFAKAMCGPSADESIVARITDDVLSMHPEVAVGILGSFVGRRDELRDNLQSLSAPIAAISCESYRPKNVAFLRSLGIDHVELPGTGHYLMIEQPDMFNAALEQAIDRMKPPLQR